VYYKRRVINKAKNIALSNNHNFHLAAILYRGKRLIKVGTNARKTHPRFVRVFENGICDSHLHAEMSVLRFAKPGDVIIVLRWKKSGVLSMSKPCIHCQGFLKSAGIKEVHYTDCNGEFKLWTP